MIAGFVNQERLREVLHYDAVTGKFCWLRALSTSTYVGQEAGSTGDNGYVKISIDGRRYAAHALAWLYVHGEWTMVDHENRIGNDNRLSNLRLTTYQLNAANRSRVISNSGVKGVWLKRGKYEAGIKINQKRIYLGIYDDIEDAAEAYRMAALKYFGEFANVD